MNAIIYNLGFVSGIIFLIAAVLLYIFLDIRSIGRYLKAHGKKVPKIMEKSDQPLIKKKEKKENIQFDKALMETVLLNDEENKED